MRLWTRKVSVIISINYSHNHYTEGLSDNNIVLGKHSGRHAFRSRLTELGKCCDYIN